MKNYSTGKLTRACKQGFGKKSLKQFDQAAYSICKVIDTQTPDPSAGLFSKDKGLVEFVGGLLGTGARLKRNKHIFIGVVIGATGAYVYMTYKNRKAKKVIVHEVRSY